jgi:hypothetical protein
MSNKIEPETLEYERYVDRLRASHRRLLACAKFWRAPIRGSFEGRSDTMDKDVDELCNAIKEAESLS